MQLHWASTGRLQLRGVGIAESLLGVAPLHPQFREWSVRRRTDPFPTSGNHNVAQESKSLYGASCSCETSVQPSTRQLHLRVGLGGIRTEPAQWRTEGAMKG